MRVITPYLENTKKRIGSLTDSRKVYTLGIGPDYIPGFNGFYDNLMEKSYEIDQTRNGVSVVYKNESFRLFLKRILEQK